MRERTQRVTFSKVVIQKQNDSLCAESVMDKTIYRVVSSHPISVFLKPGVVCNAMIVGDTAYIVRTSESSFDVTDFSPEYIVRISNDEQSVLIVRPLKDKAVWVSSKRFKKHLARIKSVLKNNGLYMLSGYRRDYKYGGSERV